MPAHQRLEAPLERGHVQRPGQLHHRRHIVERAARRELLQEPQALLRVGQRQDVLLLPPPPQGRRDEAHPRSHRTVHAVRQRRDRGRLEELTQRQVDAEGTTNPRDGLRGQQRVSSELEEAPVDAHLHLRQSEHLGEEAREHLLRLRTGRGEGLGLGHDEVRCRQRPPVHLAVGRQRQRVQHHERLRHHVVGKRHAQEVTERLGHQRLARNRHRVGNEPLASRLPITRQDDGLAHRGVTFECGFHLAELHAVAAKLELMVHAAEELDSPIREHAGPVARAVHPRSRRAGIRVRNEALRGQVRTAQVATAYDEAADAQLPRNAHGHGDEPRIQHVGARIGNGPAERHGHGHAPLRSACHL